MTTIKKSADIRAALGRTTYRKVDDQRQVIGCDFFQMCLRDIDGEDFYFRTDKDMVDPPDGIAAEPGGEGTMLVQDALRVAEMVIDRAPGPGFRQAIEISAKDGRR